MSSSHTTRPPIIAVVGHIDHGKSTLLDYIRQTRVTETETGGITQHVSAYEINTGNEDDERRMTFLDTPGHEAFTQSRERGLELADIAILVVAADDSVQPQTREALQAIRATDTPFIVAINKVDKNGSDPKQVKQDLLQHEVYIEQFGGDTPLAQISAQNGTGIDELMEVLGLMADMQELTADPEAPASGFVLESSRDPKRGITATLVITNGTLTKQAFVATDSAMAPVRIMENFRGEPIDEATFSSPVNIVGWSDLPNVGTTWHTFSSKKDAEKHIERGGVRSTDATADPTDDRAVLPVILKADSQGGLDGLTKEITQLENDRLALKIIRADIGAITENDALFAHSSDSAIIVGFNVSVDNAARTVADREDIAIGTFSVIYDAIEWLQQRISERTPTVTEAHVTGTAKIIRHFSQTKSRQVVGGKVTDGTLSVNDAVTIYRRETEIGTGQILNLQHQKEDMSKIDEGMEFGAEIKAEVGIQGGDTIQAYQMIES